MNAATTARANNQSAAIALLAAASAKPAAQAPRESFAQTLSDANQSATGGLFAQPGASPPRDRMPVTRVSETNSTESEAPKSAQAVEPGDEPDASALGTNEQPTKVKPQTEATKLNVEETTEAATETRLVSSTESTIASDTPDPQQAAAITPATLAPSLVAPSTGRSNNRPLDPTAKAAAAAQEAAAITDPSTPPVAPGTQEDASIAPETAPKRGPSDPLRLIHTAEGKPIASEITQSSAPVSSKETSAASEDATVAVAPQAKNANENKSSNSNQSQGFGFFQPGKTVPQHVPGVTGNGASVGQVGSTSASNGTATVAGTPRLDTNLQPPRVPGGRVPEAPINLKLTARAASTGQPGVSQAEADSASSQISRGLTTALRNKSGQLTLWMNPESLGKLRVQLAIDGGTISARFEATSEATKQLLSQNVDALRGALEARGLTVHNLEVVAIADWTNKANADQLVPGGSKLQDEHGSPQQSTGQNLSQSGDQQGRPRQEQQGELSGAKFDWLRESEAAPIARADATSAVRADPRLITLNARLELDAVA
ncbi:MAG TPA: flagellar hook-length control protein FliK [Phycisphaerales bacterium]